MREGCLAAVSHLQHQDPSKPGCNASSLNGQLVVDLPYSAQQLSALLGILYEHRLEVGAASILASCPGCMLTLRPKRRLPVCGRNLS